MITVAPKWHKDFPADAVVVDVTSHGKSPLSPFFLGPVIVEPFKGVYNVSLNMENAWQYSKMYEEHEGYTPKRWYQWAQTGWGNPRADRYPMGKGAVPLYSLHQGKKLDYIEARKRIYGPLYIKAAVVKAEFLRLLKIHRGGGDLWLLDFDARVSDETHEEVLNNPDQKMGHAYWLKHALEAFS